jgi:Fic family protein
MEVAKVQSTTSSNRIEGISTTDVRMRELMSRKTIPRNRNEQEIAGYRDVLKTIHESHDFISITPNILLQLHRDLYSKLPQGIGGHWKLNDNVIEETDASGNTSIRFRPASAVETPAAMDSLCAAYRRAVDDARFDPLMLIPMFIFDFLCVHPFHDGNGRMSRLLTLLLLYRSGFMVGKYISLEMLIEESKADYYEALQASSAHWHENGCDMKPYVEYTLGVILKAYRELESRVEGLVTARMSKADRIRAVVEATLGKVTKRDILSKCPDISTAMVEMTLKKLLDDGFIRKVGKGRGTAYVRKD